MISGETNSCSILTDLVNDILSRLPAKSVARFRCVSKLWSSILLRPYFTEFFLTRSSARPRLLFAVEQEGDDWCFFTSPQPKIPDDEELSLEVTADCQMKFPGGNTCLEFCGRASDLIYLCPHISEHDQCIIICKPSTGQFTSLPIPKECNRRSFWRSFLGFDPIGKHFKVLSIGDLDADEKRCQYQILTLGTGNDSWRKIHCPLNHFPSSEGICINGVLYYLAEYSAEQRDGTCYMIVCFDVRSEKFKFIYRDFISYRDNTELINYKGKLGVVTWEYDCHTCTMRSLTLCLWVIKDAEEPESSKWSEYVYTIWESQFDGCDVSTFWGNPIVGVTATGEIVISTEDASKPFYVFFFNPERSTVLSVEIQGFRAANHGALQQRSRMVRVFVDHVEDLKFITM
ncbi:hypothetical protein EUTSA_v10011995mg [Eutrema salsugineum]|uniref:F-box domain-containing protein n=1 Tax=Eutrema salsugineum TaxID=72664 RepID=V4MGZ9_EUTSA|nr:F-box protein At1g31080 [Eutrema salsugineum]ESQ30576.1 hypothetical protein EUTSA_v10011995mg [Eutrema salsugineum]